MAEPLPGLKRAQYRYRIKKTDPDEDYRESEAEKEALRRKREVLSLEDLIKQRENAKIKASRPKFMSKQERAKLALENRKREVVDQRKAQEELNEKRKKLKVDGEKQLQNFTRIIEQGDTRRMFADISRTRIKDITGKPNAWVSPAVSDEARRLQERQMMMARTEAERADEALKMMSNEELDAIKESYLGRKEVEDIRKNREKKRKQKRDGNKDFNFDWDADDDTTDQGNENPLYKSVHQAALYGRGQIAGIG